MRASVHNIKENQVSVQILLFSEEDRIIQSLVVVLHRFIYIIKIL